VAGVKRKIDNCWYEADPTDVGDMIETAIWLTGDESKELRKRYEGDVCLAIDDLCKELDLVHGPVIFSVNRPGEERVPEVPDHISGQCVRLLVGQSLVVGRTQSASPEGSFINNLDPQDLFRLRDITRKVAPRYLTDEECDAVIEELGVDTALETLKENVRPFGLH
jgi:hypothetical protein